LERIAAAFRLINEAATKNREPKLPVGFAMTRPAMLRGDSQPFRPGSVPVLSPRYGTRTSIRSSIESQRLLSGVSFG